MYIIEKEDDLIKARTHKYIKRVKGRDGKWIYYYRDSSNNLTTQGEHGSEDAAQNKGRIDHIRRLAIVGLKNGVARGSDLHRYVKEHFSSSTHPPTAREVSDSLSNLGHRARRAGHEAGSESHSNAMVEEGVGHDYSEDMLKEAKEGHRLGVDEHEALINRIHNAKNEAMSGGSKKKKKKAKKVAKKTTKKVAKKTTKKKTTKKTTTSSVADQARMQSKQQALLDQLKNEYGIDLNAPAESGTDVRSPEPAPEPAPAPEPEVAELAEVEPAFAESEAPIRRMLEEQARGGNPYLSRAKEVFDRIKLDLKPERKDTVGYVFASIETLKSAGEPVDADSLVRQYNNLTGRSVRGLSVIGADFSKATGISIEEVISNPPINVEVERMKHGYAAKQFNRLKPFLKSSFTNAHQDAPPPMPTWADLKTWTEHGEGKPEWAGNTNTAVPKEVFDAAVSGTDGKKKYPPRWMPIHLMPCWNYIVSKTNRMNKIKEIARGLAQAGHSGEALGNEVISQIVNNPRSFPHGAAPDLKEVKKVLGSNFNKFDTISPYESSAPQVSGMTVDAGANANYREGIMIASLRKYVQKRGGASGMSDIPSSKLEDVGSSHERIFKSPIDDIKTLVKVKIVDPVALLSIIKEEIGGGFKVKKSFSLVIGSDEPTFAKSLFTERQLKKSLINEIKRLKSGKSFVSKL